MDSLPPNAARFLGIERGEITFGEGSPAEQAVAFFAEKLVPEVVARSFADGGRRPKGPVDLLVSLSGHSPLTTIISYEVLKPRRVLILSSTGAVDSVNVIKAHLHGRRGLKYADVLHRMCNPTDPREIYRIVKEELHQIGDASPYAVIDITGGRKVMTAAAALAAWQLRLDIGYVDSDFDPELRRVVPGSDRLLLLDNPISIFGDQEMQATLELFRTGAFAEAARRYGELATTLHEPARARFMKTLAELYRAWCDLDLEHLPGHMAAVRDLLDHERSLLAPDTVRRIEEQLGFLDRLHAGDPMAFVLCFYVLGLHYLEIGRLDFAVLFFYRVIEGCLAGRLESRAEGFHCDKPDYSLLTGDADALIAECQTIWGGLGRADSPVTLPPKVALMWAAVLLTALGDPLITKAGLAGTKALSHLDRVVGARNRSVLAHGHKRVTEDQMRELQAKAKLVLRAYLKGQERDADALCARLTFLRTDR